MTEVSQQESWHRQDSDSVCRKLGTSIDSGLSSAEAGARLDSTGPNEIEGERPPSLMRLLGRQLADYMIGLLIVAAIVSGLVGDVVDTIAIVFILVANAAVGMIQEHRAHRAVAALRDMSAPLARVVRDCRVSQLPARDIVPGDLVQLDAGDVVPADLRLVSTTDLGIDESALTGESVPADKFSEPIDDASDQLIERRNMAFKSTLITRGRGVGVTVATGRATEIGRVADLLRGDRSAKTPLQMRLARFSRRVAAAVLMICAVVFLAGVLEGQPVLFMLLVALSLAVAAVPEALPAVITMALGLGARRLGEQNALVRRLPAVESLGSVTYICADKTGTLTENRMTLGVIVTGGRRYEHLSEIAENRAQRLGQVLALCGDVEQDDARTRGDPTEIALVDAALQAGFDRRRLDKLMPRVGELPFEAGRRCMVTLHRTESGLLALVKGAPETIIRSCASGATREDLATADALAREGFRVLGLACREFDAGAGDPELSGGWTFLGLVGLIDPPRAGVREAIANCRSAGIVPVMITGDHPATAHAIATELDIESGAASSITGAELDRLDDAGLEDRVESLRVYARVDPEQKIRIVKALQRAGHFVAMTGDGVNDAPALKQATIGIAMGRRGTDVAREAAEIVLLDDSFATIVMAVREGRRIFDDIRKFIRYTMTSNTGEIWVLVLAPLLGLPIPLLPLHILWINLVTDGFPGLALAAEPAEPDVMDRRPRPPGEGIFRGEMVAQIIWVGLAIGGLTLGMQAWALDQQRDNWQTMVFSVLVFAQLFNSLAIRSERLSLFTIGLSGNPALTVAVMATVAAQLLVIYVPFLNGVFHTAPLSVAELALCFVLGATVLFAVELEKLVRRRQSS